MNTTANCCSPAVTHAMEPVLPGAFAVITVGGVDETTPVYAIPLANAVSRHPADGMPVASSAAMLLSVQYRREECLTVDMPAHAPAVFALQTTPRLDSQTAWFANRPRINWFFPAQPAAGGELRLLGRNLVRYDHYVSADPVSPASQGRLVECGLFSPETGSRCLLRHKGGDEYLPVVIQAASSYEARIWLPESLAPGEYELFVHNGLGGPAGWSDPLAVPISEAVARDERVFSLEAYLQPGRSVDEAFAAALGDLGRNGGGVLELGPRTYALGRTLVLPEHTRLRGAGSARTLLMLPHHTAGGAEAPFVAITGDGGFSVEDIAIRGVYAPLLICAPTFLPVTQDEAARGWVAVGLSDRRARNVTIRRCRLEQYPFHHSMRRKDFDQRGWMKSFGEAGWKQIHGFDHFACIAFKGDGLIVEDCVIQGGGHAVDMSRTAYARISRNVLRAGHYGMAVHGFSRLTWPAGGGGAKIEGNEMRRIIVEDNDISARSEFARNLVSFNFGGDELFIARNHIYGISPNCDSEALMTHLWTARWCQPRVRITGPLSAEILDPSGEVADECLDGAWLDVLQGRGMGQVRRICRREGSRIWFDQPWRLPPDETSVIAFTAPSLFRNLTMTDNRIESQAVNIILWGSSFDSVIDGNYVAEGPGITLWSMRLAGDQKVWGGGTYTLVCNNTMDRGYGSPSTESETLDNAMGFFIRCGRDHDCADAGYDVLGLIVRNNHSTNNSGIGIRTTFSERQADGTLRPWKIRYAGIVVENNLCTDSVVGIAVEDGADVALRGNACRDVQYPFSRVKIPFPILDATYTSKEK